MNFNQLIFIFLSCLCLPFYGQDIESKLTMKKGNNAYLSGDVSNSNPDILLHNWHKEE